MGITNRYSTPSYPQSNGQAEATNKSIVNGLKKRLDDSKGRWTEELTSVLWAYQTTLRRSTEEIPFLMTYSVEAIILVEIGLPTSRTDKFVVKSNNQLLYRHLDLVEENCEVASVRLANYQQRISHGYNKGIKCQDFIPRDLVLRKVLGNTRDPTMGKLGPNWEGPYRVTSIAGTGAYRLEDLDERLVIRPWNVSNLKKYYF